MSHSKPPTISHRLEYLAFRGLEGVLRLMSLETTFRLGELIGTLIHRFAAKPRATVIRNLRFAFGREKSPREIKELTTRIFERTAANLFSSIRVPFLKDEEIASHLTLVGLDEVLASPDKRGIVAVSPHMGNWELLAQVAHLARDAFKVGTHYRPLNNRFLDSLVERRRQMRGLKLFAKRSSGHTMATFVKNGGFLGILADQRVGGRGTPAVFFGRPTTCSPLPDLMARRGNGRLFSLVCETSGVAQWKVSLTPIPEISAQACATSLENAWRRSPEDVFWFEERWRLQSQSRLRFLEKYPSDHQVTRPLRLVNLTASAQPLLFPESLLTQEKHEVTFDQPDRFLREELRKISELGDTPVDAFIAPASQQKRLSRLNGKVLVFTPEVD